jgi:hypothetical protein
VVASGELALGGFAARGRDEQLVGPEIVLAAAGHGDLQYPEDRAVEGSGGCEILHDQLDVVDQAAAVEFVGRHAALLRKHLVDQEIMPQLAAAHGARCTW